MQVLALQAQIVTKLVLVNAETDQDIAELSDDYTINLSMTGLNLNNRAEVYTPYFRFAPRYLFSRGTTKGHRGKAIVGYTLGPMLVLSFE